MNDTSTLRIACEMSDSADTAEAMQRVLETVAPQLEGGTDLAAVFFSPHHLPRASFISSTLHDALAPEVVIGCSAVGVAGNDREYERGPGLSVFAASLPNGARLRTFNEIDLDWPNSAEDDEALRAAVGADEDDLRAVLLLVDPFTPINRMLPALSRALAGSLDRPGVPLIGGVASAANKPGENRMLIRDTVRTGGLVGLSIMGNVRVDSVVSQGCRPIGKPLLVTGGKHNILQTLGGRPALQAFQDLAGELTDYDRRLLEKGLFIGLVVNEYQERFGRGDFLIRNVIGVDQNRGLLAVSDLVRVGQTVQFHVRDARSASDDLELTLAAQQIDDQAAGALLFTCNGRGSNLFREPHHDTKTIQRMLPDTPLAGFFASGEIGPVGNQSYIHGFTASMALFRSR